jgi:hypothetical protein
MFCFVVVLVGTDTLIRNQNTVLLSNFAMLSAYFCTIAYSLARQPCARLPGSLARACPAALRALARQPCARFPGSLVRAAG